MTGKKTAVFGIYKTLRGAENAVDELVKYRFSNADVSVLLPDNQGTKDFAHEKNTKAPEGTTTGVATGGTIGGTLGLLAGIGALAIPGLGPFIAAGPIMGALAGLGVGGAVGGLVGALIGMGIPEYEAKRYEGRVKDGGVLLSVHCDTSERDRAGEGDFATDGRRGHRFNERRARIGDLGQPRDDAELKIGKVAAAHQRAPPSRSRRLRAILTGPKGPMVAPAPEPGTKTRS